MSCLLSSVLVRILEPELLQFSAPITASAFNIFLKINKGIILAYQAPDRDCVYTATDVLFKSTCEKPLHIEIKVEAELEGACIREGSVKQRIAFWRGLI